MHRSRRGWHETATISAILLSLLARILFEVTRAY